MLHDAPNIGSNKYIDAADAIINVFKNRLKVKLSSSPKKIVIAISGESGSGKTSISYQFCKQLMGRLSKKGRSISIKHLYVDNFYLENYQMQNPASREERAKIKKYKGIGPDEYDWRMIENILHCFKNGYVCRMPCVDVLNQQIDHLETNFSEVDILLLDGLFAIDSRMKADLRFLIDGAYYKINNWEFIREKYVDALGATEVLHKYAHEVVEFTSSSQQDIRGKEKLSEARIICLEKEHEALQKMLNTIRNKGCELSILQYVNDKWEVDL